VLETGPRERYIALSTLTSEKSQAGDDNSVGLTEFWGLETLEKSTIMHVEWEI